jgi:flagellar hook-basal body complex protein FliE
MGYLGVTAAGGNAVSMLVTDPRHMGAGAAQAAPAADAEGGFGQLLMQALDSVNTDQQKAMNLTQQMITAPDSVNVHDVTIALASANLSLSIAKAVVDRAIRAYQEIIAVR